MTKFKRVVAGFAIALSGLAVGSALSFASLWLYTTRIYLPRHSLPPGTGVVIGGILPSLFGGLLVASAALLFFIVSTRTSKTAGR